jgi:2-amino-4-hydroxy-6-hydroxymethyldihydropteridine diphosphokinase
MLQRVFLGLGSNIGNREMYIRNSLKKFCSQKDFLFIAISKIYESEPWGFKNQSKFLNCVAVFLYRSDPERLLTHIKDVERSLGRTNNKKWYPREIDVDILFFGDKVINKKELKIPHPFLHLRNFVLKPLCDLNPGIVHPGLKENIETLLKRTQDRGKVYLFKNQYI